jgi:VWFA-related protein
VRGPPRSAVRPRLGTALAAGAALALASGAGTQEEPVPRFPARADLVEIEVVVTDSRGAMVRDLRREDFVLLEDGKPQAITHFALRTTRAPAPPVPVTEGSRAPSPPPVVPVEVRPRHIVLAVDDLHLAPENLLNAKRVLRRFVEEQLLPEDVAAFVTTSGQLGFLEQFTKDRVVLLRAIDRLASVSRKESESTDPPQMSVYQADLIQREDRQALGTAVAELMREDPLLTRDIAELRVRAKAGEMVSLAAHFARTALRGLESMVRRLQAVEGRKILVLLSDGFYMGTADRPDLQRITGQAARSGVVIYSLDTRGLPARPPTGDASRAGFASIEHERYWRLGFEADRDGLSALARDTGGLPIFNLGDLNVALERVLDDTEAYYLLAFEPASPVRDGRFHKIAVRVAGRRGLSVRTRKGYFAPESEVASKPAPKAADPTRAASSSAAGSTDPRLREALVSLAPRQDVPVELAAGFFDDPDGGPEVRVGVEVDPSRLQFARDGELRIATLELSGLIVDERGQPVRSFGDRRELRLDEEAYERALEQGISFSTRSTLPPGLYQVRVALLDGGERLGTAMRWAEVPDLARRQLALSDLFLTVGGQHEARPVRDGRRLPRDEEMEFVLFAYNARGDAEVSTDLLFETQILAGSEPVVAENPQNIVVPMGEPPQERVAFSRRLLLSALEPGEYTLRVKVTDRIAKTSIDRSFRFWIE